MLCLPPPPLPQYLSIGCSHYPSTLHQGHLIHIERFETAVYVDILLVCQTPNIFCVYLIWW